MREMSVTEERYKAILAVIGDGRDAPIPGHLANIPWREALAPMAAEATNLSLNSLHSMIARSLATSRSTACTLDWVA